MTEAASTDVAERLARIEVKIDQFLIRSDDHETRLRKVERMLWVAVGAALAGGGVAGAVVSQVLGAA